MSRAAALTCALTILATLTTTAPAAADEKVICNPLTGECTVVVEAPGRGGGAGGGGGGKGGGAKADPIVDAPPSLVEQCYMHEASPQPPLSDPAWAGRTPADGKVYIRTCPISKSGPVSSFLFVANGQPAPPTVTPLQLAQSALASLTLPTPAIRRSPTAKNRIDGSPYTWANVWTWYWTAPGNWRTQSKRAVAGPVWAEVTVEPAELIYRPGDGAAAVVCSGPGRPWRQSDGNRPPGGGGCAYKYENVTRAGPVTATLTIRWRVTWIGSGVARETLPDMTTSTDTQLSVQQLQVVNR